MLRKRRKANIEDLINKVYAAKGSVSILDMGGRKSYWNIFGKGYLDAMNVNVTLVNLEFDGAAVAGRFMQFRGDACDLPYRDNTFDIVHSNSVIEHVGEWPKRERFADEVRRLAPIYYVQTPYFWFPMEPHFLLPVFHWLPQGVRAKLLLSLGRNPDMGDAMRAIADELLDRRQMQFLFPDAQHSFEWFGPLPKSLIAIRG
jgi:hypothetical protein